VWFSKASPVLKSPSGTQTASPLQRTWITLLRNGSSARKRRQVSGARAVSSRAVKRNGPTSILRWSIGEILAYQALRRKTGFRLVPGLPKDEHALTYRAAHASTSGMGRRLTCALDRADHMNVAD
jgi:hypothetical protein